MGNLLMKSSFFASALALTVAGGLLASTAASAITYSGSFSASNFLRGSGSLKGDYTITTDGTLGTLSAGNYTGYTLSLNYNNVIRNSSGNAVYAGYGTGGSATASALSFDFGTFQNGIVFFDGNDALCFVAAGLSCVGEPTPASLLYSAPIGANGYLPRSGGVEVIATSGAVPEPASWAMLIAGFGLVGAAARRKKIAVAA